MAPPTPNDDASSSPVQDSSPRPNPTFSKHMEKAIADSMAWAAAHQNDPPQRERIVPSERIDVSGRPKNHGGPIRILSKDGVLTELGKRAERERLEKSAAAEAAGTKEDDGGKGKSVAGSTEESSSF